MKRTWVGGVVLVAAGIAGGIGWCDGPVVATSAPASTAAGTASSAPEPAKMLSAVRQTEYEDRDGWTFFSFADCALYDVTMLKQDATAAEKAARTKFMNEHKIDGPVWWNEDDPFYIAISTGPGTAMLKVDNTAWEKFSPAEIEQTVQQPGAQKGGGAHADPHAPVTFVFRTIHGTTGIAQITERHEGEKRQATIKTKIIQTAAAATQ